LAAVARRPVILQTTGGTAYQGPIPPVRLLVELAKDFPHFGYVKRTFRTSRDDFLRISHRRQVSGRSGSAVG
jgi:hypothetical protein